MSILVTCSDKINYFSKLAVLLTTIFKVRELCTSSIRAIRFMHYCIEVESSPINGGITKLVLFLKASTPFRLTTLLDIVCIDHPGYNFRFTLMYILWSPYYNSRLFIKCRVADLTVCPSITTIFNSGAWSEREIWDLFGISFNNNPDLRRLLTDYGFQGHPLRKDYPLSGYFELMFSISKQRIVSLPVSFAQEFRNFSFTNPWLSAL